MSFIGDKVVEIYNYAFTDLAAPRTNSFFLMPSPWPILAITGLYLYICTSFGPRYMKHRQPYNLKNVVLVYNVFQVIMSSYLCYEGVVYMSSEKFSFSCDPVDYSDDPRAVRVTSAAWWYFFTKITEFLDTIFFVLRKKNNQISFLHVYHHSMMAIMMWIGVKYIPGGHGLLMGALNAFVHVVMYTYYLIAGLGPQYQKYIWWKKHVTVLQLAQFLLILIHNLNALFSDCSYPKIANVLMCVNAILFINLFGRFFYATYLKRPAKNGTAKNGIANNGTAENGTVKNGTAKNGISNNGTAENGTVKNGTAKKGIANNGTAENGSVTNEICKSESGTNGTDINGLHLIGSTHSLHKKATDKNGVTLNGKQKDV